MSLPTIVVEAGFPEGASTALYLHLDDVVRGILDIATLGPATIWTDISPYVHRFAIERGANRTESPILRYDAGIAIVELDNSDRRFDPTNLSGPYVSAGVTQVTPMRAIRIRAIWMGVTYDLFRGFADEWQLEYVPPNYSRCTLRCTDATKVLRNVDRAAVGAVGAGESSGARVTRILNSASWSSADRKISNGNTTVQSTTLAGSVWAELELVQDTELGELYIDGAGRVVFRGRQGTQEDLRSISAQALFGDQSQPALSTTTTINYARNPSIEVDTSDWSAGGTVPPTLAQSSAQAKFGTKSLLATWGTGGVLPLVDVIVPGLVLGNTYTASVYVYVPTGSPDVSIVLSGLPDFFDALGTGTGGLRDQWVRLEKTHICDITTTTTWHPQIWPATSPTSGQQVYIDGLMVEDSPAAGPSAVFVDGTQANSEWDGPSHVSSSRRLVELPYANTEIAYDDETIANFIRITRVGGAEQTAQDAASQQLYLVRTYERSDLIMETNAVAADYAGYILHQAKDPELRFATLDLLPRRDELALFPQALGRQFGDRIRISRRPPGGGTITREALIRGVRHEYDPGRGHWGTRWVLQSATKLSFLILDHNTLGTLDNNALGY